MKSESIYWDLSTQPFLVFKNIGTKKKKISNEILGVKFSGQKWLVDVTGQRIIANVV